MGLCFPSPVEMGFHSYDNKNITQIIFTQSLSALAQLIWVSEAICALAAANPISNA